MTPAATTAIVEACAKVAESVRIACAQEILHHIHALRDQAASYEFSDERSLAIITRGCKALLEQVFDEVNALDLSAFAPALPRADAHVYDPLRDEALKRMAEVYDAQASEYLARAQAAEARLAALTPTADATQRAREIVDAWVSERAREAVLDSAELAQLARAIAHALTAAPSGASAPAEREASAGTDSERIRALEHALLDLGFNAGGRCFGCALGMKLVKEDGFDAQHHDRHWDHYHPCVARYEHLWTATPRDAHGCVVIGAPASEPVAGEAPYSREALFRTGAVTLHSGAVSNFKIDCDALTDEDWKTLAMMLADHVGVFSRAVGVPRGGLRLAHHLNRVAWSQGDPILIVDDVLTTGASMERMRAEILNGAPDREIKGAVVFARGPAPAWVTPLFVLTPATGSAAVAAAEGAEARLAALEGAGRGLLEALDDFLGRLLTSETLPSDHECAGHKSIVAVDALDSLLDLRNALAAYRAALPPAPHPHES